MVIGNDIHNTNRVAALESLDALVVVDEMNCGIRYAPRRSWRCWKAGPASPAATRDGERVLRGDRVRR